MPPGWNEHEVTSLIKCVRRGGVSSRQGVMRPLLTSFYVLGFSYKPFSSWTMMSLEWLVVKRLRQIFHMSLTGEMSHERGIRSELPPEWPRRGLPLTLQAFNRPENQRSGRCCVGNLSYRTSSFCAQIKAELTFDNAEHKPRWSPGGHRIISGSRTLRCVLISFWFVLIMAK